MALKHAQYMDVVDLNVTPIEAEPTGSVSLLKTDRIQLLRLVLKKGNGLPDHRVPGPITIQCVSGTIVVTSGMRTEHLGPNHLVALEGCAPHSVTAATDAVLLVTLLHNVAP